MVETADNREAWLDSLLLGLLCMLVYIGNATFVNPSGDSVPTSVLPFSLLIHHNFYVGRYIVQPHQPIPYYIHAFRNHFISGSPIGAAITSIPIYAAYLLFGGHPGAVAGASLGKVSAVLISGISVVWLYWVMTRLSVSRLTRLIFTVLYGLGSETMSISSQGLWQHGPAQLWIVAFLFFVTTIYSDDATKKWFYVGAGVAVGMLLLSRPVDLVLIVPFLLLCRQGRIFRSIWITIISFLPFLVLNMVYDYHFFGHILSTGYGSASTEASLFSFPLIPGLMGNLFSPSKGLFVFMPWTLVSFAWLRHLRSKRFTDSVYLPALLSFIPYIILYALFYQWPAGYSYGPRYMSDVLPILTLLGAGYASAYWDVNWTPRKASTFAVLTSFVAAWSIGVQLLGTYVESGGAWNAAARPNTFMSPLWAARGSQPAYYLNTLKALLFQPSPINNPSASFSSLQLLDKPYIFRKGTTPTSFLTNTVYHGTIIAKNTGAAGWSAYPNRAGADVVHFSYTVWGHGKEITQVPSIRTALLHSVQSGQSIKVYFQFLTPSTPGTYTYVFTLVDEGVAWFQGGLDSKNAVISSIRVKG